MIDKNIFFEVYRKVGSNVNYLGVNDYLDIYSFVGFSKNKDLELGKSIDKVFDAIRFFMNEEGISLNKCSLDVFNPLSGDFSKYLVLYPSEYAYYLDVFDTKSLFKSFSEDGIDSIIYSYDSDSFRFCGNSKRIDKVLKLEYKES